LAARSSEIAIDAVIAQIHQSISEIEHLNEYKKCHPLTLREQNSDVPFAPEIFTVHASGDLGRQPFASIFITGPKVLDVQDGRRLWAEFKINVENPDVKDDPPLIGGLILGSYPYQPSYLNDAGEPSANHGYPREIRISWKESDDPDVVDDEISQTFQLPAWHSASYVIPTAPVRTRQIILRVADFPRRIAKWNNSRSEYDEVWGIALPIVVPFLYSPSTIKNVTLEPGVVSVTQSDEKRKDSFFSAALQSPNHDAFRGAESTWIRVKDGKAYPFTPQSAVIPQKLRRQYRLFANDQPIMETFVSNRLAQGEGLYWLLAQSDEHNRCLAGLRIIWTSATARREIGVEPTLPAARAQIYEYDPLPGTPVARIKPQLSTDRFSRLLADVEAAPDENGKQDIRFARTSLCSWIYLVLTAKSAGHLAITELDFLRSAFVSLVSRPSRTQNIRAVHFRLTGGDIGNDYAVLGEPGFTIAIDRVTAGEQRDRLFEALSLEELVRSGVAKLVMNSRARAVERQSSRVLPGSFSSSNSRTRTDGWERSETGASVHLPPSFSPADALTQPDGEHGFTSLANEEVRTHVQHLANIGSRFRNRIKPHYSGVFDQTAPNDDLLWKMNAGQSGNAVWPAWRATNATIVDEVRQELQLSGLWNVSLPPYFNRFFHRIEQNGGINDTNAIEDALYHYKGEILLINGASTSFTLSASGIVVSGSWTHNIASSGVAAALQSHSIGTTGSISKTAREAGYSYNQAVTAGASRIHTEVSYDGGLQDNLITRQIPDDQGLAQQRLIGAETMWNGNVLDLVIGVIPTSISLPALNESGFRTTDEALRVGFGCRPRKLDVDVWFDLREELVRDDDRSNSAKR
jgi:hypothetical protein